MHEEDAGEQEEDSKAPLQAHEVVKTEVADPAALFDALPLEGGEELKQAPGMDLLRLSAPVDSERQTTQPVVSLSPAGNSGTNFFDSFALRQERSVGPVPEVKSQPVIATAAAQTLNNAAGNAGAGKGKVAVVPDDLF